MADFLVWTVWFLAAAGCLGSGIAVITFTNPFYSALALIGNLGSLAVLFLLASAEFLAAAQVLVYAGAVMVMFLFVIAYLGDRSEGVRLSGGPSWVRIGAIVAATALLVEVVVVIGMAAGDQLSDPAEVKRSFGSPEEIGRLFLTDHLLAFEITSIVLLSLEIMLNGANLALIAFSRHYAQGDGQIFALTVMAVAASEVVVGLGLIVAIARRKLDLDVDKLSTLRG